MLEILEELENAIDIEMIKMSVGFLLFLVIGLSLSRIGIIP